MNSSVIHQSSIRWTQTKQKKKKSWRSIPAICGLFSIFTSLIMCAQWGGEKKGRTALPVGGVACTFRLPSRFDQTSRSISRSSTAYTVHEYAPDCTAFAVCIVASFTFLRAPLQRRWCGFFFLVCWKRTIYTHKKNGSSNRRINNRPGGKVCDSFWFNAY